MSAEDNRSMKKNYPESKELTLKAPIATSRLLFSSAEMFKKPLWQTVWTQIQDPASH